MQNCRRRRYSSTHSELQHCTAVSFARCIASPCMQTQPVSIELELAVPTPEQNCRCWKRTLYHHAGRLVTIPIELHRFEMPSRIRFSYRRYRCSEGDILCTLASSAVAVRVSDALEFGANQAAALCELKQICCCLDHIPVICLLCDQLEGGHHGVSKRVANVGGVAGDINKFVLTERERENITLILLLVSFRHFV